MRPNYFRAVISTLHATSVFTPTTLVKQFMIKTFTIWLSALLYPKIQILVTLDTNISSNNSTFIFIAILHYLFQITHQGISKNTLHTLLYTNIVITPSPKTNQLRRVHPSPNYPHSMNSFKNQTPYCMQLFPLISIPPSPHIPSRIESSLQGWGVNTIRF